MRLHTLELRNFRCFADLKLDLHPNLTLLVAENGQGKSTVLDAIRIALWPYVNSFDLARKVFNDPGNGIAISDVRLLQLASGDMARQLPSSVTVSGDYGAESIHQWTRYRDSEAPSTKTKSGGDISGLKEWAGTLQVEIRNP